MKAIFGKWLPVFLALLIFQIIVIIIVLIWTFYDVGVFKSVYDFIAKSPLAFDIFNAITDYAAVISGVIVFVELVITFFSLRKYQRGRAVNRLHNWARNSVVILAQYRQANPDGAGAAGAKYAEAKILVEKLIANSNSALADARTLRGEINDKTGKTVDMLLSVREKLAGEDDSLFDDLQTLQHDFADVMILAFEFIK
jgi:hypothetical protein